MDTRDQRIGEIDLALPLGRNGQVGDGNIAEFETGYAKLLGAKRCLATSSGTTALITAMQAIGLDAGSTTCKAVLIDDGRPVAWEIMPVLPDPVASARAVASLAARSTMPSTPARTVLGVL